MDIQKFHDISDADWQVLIPEEVSSLATLYRRREKSTAADTIYLKMREGYRQRLAALENIDGECRDLILKEVL